MRSKILLVLICVASAGPLISDDEKEKGGKGMVGGVVPAPVPIAGNNGEVDDLDMVEDIYSDFNNYLEGPLPKRWAKPADLDKSIKKIHDGLLDCVKKDVERYKEIPLSKTRTATKKAAAAILAKCLCATPLPLEKSIKAFYKN